MNLNGLKFNPIVEKLTSILMRRTQNDDPLFFQLLTSYFLTKMASMMRAKVVIEGTKKPIPINMYAINLAVSGSGKGHSISIMEDQVLGGFREDFMSKVFYPVSNRTLAKIANRRANNKGTDPDDESTQVHREFDEMGNMPFAFDSATSPAVKQMRVKLLMAGCGSLNMEIDEIGSNLLQNSEVLSDFLELFDLGRIKQKLVKNTKENNRSEDLFGSTPTNMLLFGTPVKLLNGSKVEDEFYEMLSTGLARRCFFGYTRVHNKRQQYTAQDLYDIYTNSDDEDYLNSLNSKFTVLADASMFDREIVIPKAAALSLYEYKLECEAEANKLSEFEEVKKTEWTHRYFKAKKLAGAYAFIDNSYEVEPRHITQAVAMAEASGRAFQRILDRDRPHVKLAHYIATIGKEVTQADLVEDLPFYKGTESNKKDMMSLAIAHGYKHNIIITQESVDNIWFYKGSSIPENDPDKCRFSVSKEITEGYKDYIQPFDKLHQLVTKPGFHWVNHHLEKGYRHTRNVVPGFNLVVIDIDKGVSVDTAKLLLQDYSWLIHTTKRHTDDAHRFRIIFPTSHFLEMKEDEHREFMRNVYAWLPFTVDEQTNERSRKWETYGGKHWYGDGELLDVLQFIPKTKKAEDRKQVIATQTSLNNLERWFVMNTENGNRNNKLLRYGYYLADTGMSFDSIMNNVLVLNSKLEEPLPEMEIHSTIARSIQSKVRNV